MEREREGRDRGKGSCRERGGTEGKGAVGRE